MTMLNRRIFNAIVGTIPFIGLNPKEQKNELAEYIFQKISEQHAIEDIKVIGIEWQHYSVELPTWFYYQPKDRIHTKIWATIPQKFNTSTDNLIKASKVIEGKNIECFLVLVDSGIWYSNQRVEVST